VLTCLAQGQLDRLLPNSRLIADYHRLHDVHYQDSQHWLFHLYYHEAIHHYQYQDGEQVLDDHLRRIRLVSNEEAK